MSKSFPNADAAQRYAQEQANLERKPWVWFNTKTGEHIAEKADLYHHIEINDTVMRGDIVICRKKATDPLKTVAWPQEPSEPVVPDIGPILRCTWCGKDSAADENGDCVHCGDASLTDRTRPHMPEWSRATISEVECKVCDRRGPYSIQASRDWCDNTNNPKIATKHEKDPI